MTYEDVKRIRENPSWNVVENTEYLEMINKAIEKQIPKKPIVKDNDEARLLELDCPCCENNNILPLDKYCSKCGQALDWSGEE